MENSPQSVEGQKARGDETRARILAVARRLFMRQGYAATPVSQIARETELTIPPIYYHFGSKLGLFQAVVEATGNRIAEEVDGLDTSSLRQGLTALMIRAIDRTDDHVAGLRLRLLASFQQDENAETLRQIMSEQRARATKLVAAFCKAMIGTQDPLREQRAEMMASLYLSGMQHLWLDAMSGSAPTIRSLGAERLLDLLVDVGEMGDFKAFAQKYR
jgi:AcrR family transcriptional regulator